MGSVGIAHDGHVGLQSVNAVEEPIEVGVVEIVVEKAERKVDVRVVRGLEAAVFTVADRIPEFVGIGRKRMSGRECYVGELLGVGDAAASVSVVVEGRLFDPLPPVEEGLFECLGEVGIFHCGSGMEVVE